MVDKSQTVCKLCHAVKAYKGCNTSNMNAHLNAFHTDILNPSHTKQDAKKQAIIMSTFSKLDATPLSKDGKIHKEITSYLSEWIIKDLIPLSTLDRPPFVNFVHALKPRYQKPCRKTFTSVILPQLYAETKGSLLTELSKYQSFGITTDGWTSMATQSFMAVTVHFIDNNWEMISRVLQTRHPPVCHTADHLAEALTDSFSEWGLSDKNIIGTTDNSRNILTAWGLLDKLENLIVN